MTKSFGFWKIFFVSMSVIFISKVFTGAHFSSSVSSSGNAFTAGTWDTTPTPEPASVVINEFMANPSGPEPADEWIELFNGGGSSIDVGGWYIYDDVDSHSLPITSANVVGGSTVIGAGGFLVVNYQSPSTFSLNNTGSESVRIYNGILTSGLLIDSVTYSGTVVDKTWARTPDGTGIISNNHTPTPGGPNV